MDARLSTDDDPRIVRVAGRRRASVGAGACPTRNRRRLHSFTVSCRLGADSTGGNSAAGTKSPWKRQDFRGAEVVAGAGFELATVRAAAPAPLRLLVLRIGLVAWQDPVRVLMPRSDLAGRKGALRPAAGKEAARLWPTLLRGGVHAGRPNPSPDHRPLRPSRQRSLPGRRKSHRKRNCGFPRMAS